VSRAYCPKLTRASIARREANGSACAICGAAFDPGRNAVKFCSLACVHENNRRIARDPARIARRFWAKVDKCGPVPSHKPELGPCWVWTATLDRKGYGKITVELPEGRLVAGAHRLSWLIAYGRWPNPWALHHCDNPACVRPEHLFEGDVVDNFLDMRAKGRPANGSVVIVASTVRDIRAAIASGESKAAIARRVGVSHGAIQAIAHGRTWKHVG
jgi:hypothetical protein